MDNVYIVRLKFDGPLHIGTDIPGIGEEAVQEIIHSDTIFSALINNYSEISQNKESIEGLLEDFNKGEIPFRITSGYIYSGSDLMGFEYYVPKPKIDPPDFYHEQHGAENRLERGKRVREARLIKLDTCYNWIRDKYVLQELEESNRQFGETHSVEIRPRHTRDRISEEAMIFHTGLIHFQKSAGIYFLIQIKNDCTSFNMDTLRFILEAMKKRGLGGKVSSGFGSIGGFEIQNADQDENWKRILGLPEQEYSLLLSLYHPGSTHSLVAQNYPAYGLVNRSGWVYSASVPVQVKRKSCLMFAEGSVIRERRPGVLVDVTPESFEGYHRVYRYGLSFALPIMKYWSDDFE